MARNCLAEGQTHLVADEGEFGFQPKHGVFQPPWGVAQAMVTGGLRPNGNSVTSKFARRAKRQAIALATVVANASGQ